MTLKCSHKLLLVDDEKSILRSLQRLFRKYNYEILTAGNGLEALEVLEQAGDTVSLIISDQRMPKMNGSQFLERAVEIAPNAHRFLLTGYADLDAVTEAVNNGKIHRYLTKPWQDKDLLVQVQSALSQVELQLENKRLSELTERQNKALAKLNRDLEKKVLERTWALQVQNKMLNGKNQGLLKSLLATVRLLTSLVEYSNAQLGHYMQEAARMAVEIATEAGLDEKARNTIEMAALVHDIGLLGMDKDSIRKDVKIMNPAQFESYSRHPLIAGMCLSSIDGFDEIADIVQCHHECVDGSGFPRKISSEQIPDGAKILSVAADYCTVLHLWPHNIHDLMVCARRYMDRDVFSSMDISDKEIRLEIAENVILSGSGKRYDSEVIKIFVKIAERNRPRPKLQSLDKGSLHTGMTLMQDLRMNDGRLLLSKGTLLNERSIQSISKIGLDNLAQNAVLVAGTHDRGDSEESDGA